jgi:L-histidine Nalpha-methyltransferase
MPRAALREETARGLGNEPKELPAVWLYDERGSELYDEITLLDEYYLPRREAELLRMHASEIASRAQPRTLVELGAGSARNVRLLLDAITGLERFVPLDANEGVARANAEAVAAAYPGVRVQPVTGDFERDLGLIPAGARTLVALLGSTIGNLVPERRSRLLAGVRCPLLLGLDLVKDPARMEAAYNDPSGVTERFVRNALTAVNRELAADFDQSRFDYEAVWDPGREWMDIGFRARDRHTVRVGALDLHVVFEQGEFLRAEISAKFRRDSFEREAVEAGLRVDGWWSDAARDYALALLSPS